MSLISKNKLDVLVLHVEDSKEYREQFNFLAKLKVRECISAGDGKEGLEMYKQYKPDIIITDISMPIMDGIEMSKQIKEIDNNAQIIILSSLEKESYLLKAINIGIDQFVVKGINSIHELTLALERSAKQISLYKQLKNQSAHIQMLSRAIEQSSSMVVITDFTGAVEYANKAFYDTTGYKDYEVLGMNLSDFKDDNYKILWDSALKDDNSKAEYLHKKSNKSQFWVSSTLTAVKDDNNKIINFVEVTDDITERKKLDMALKQASEAKSNFLANMSHELRTPLNGVIGMASLLLDTNPTAKQKEYLQMQKNAAEALLSIINNIIDFSKIESGKFEISKYVFDLHATIQKTIEFFILDANAKSLNISYEIDQKLPKLLIGDSGRLKQVLINVLGNAVKFTEDGFVKLYVKLMAQDTTNNNILKVRFIIQDSGIGIEEDKIPIIFNRFTQADSSFTRKYGGTGIGLALVKELIDLMHGTITVESEVNKGSTFVFDLAFEKPMPNKLGSTEKQVQKVHKTRKDKFKLLLVEDNLLNQRIIMDFFAKRGDTVVTAINGLDAVQKYQVDAFDFILMDIEMPIMNGFEATEKIREYEKKNNKSVTPILAVTAHTSNETREKCYESGMNDFVMKPIDFASFMEILERNI